MWGPRRCGASGPCCFSRAPRVFRAAVRARGAGLLCAPHGCSGCRRARPPARLGVLTAFGAASRGPPGPPGPPAPSTPVGLWWLTLLGASSRSPARPRRRPRAPQPGPPIPPAPTTPVGLWWLTLLDASSRSPARPHRRPRAPQLGPPIPPAPTTPVAVGFYRIRSWLPACRGSNDATFPFGGAEATT